MKPTLNYPTSPNAQRLSFAQILSEAGLHEGRQIVVPVFQRGYVWDVTYCQSLVMRLLKTVVANLETLQDEFVAEFTAASQTLVLQYLPNAEVATTHSKVSPLTDSPIKASRTEASPTAASPTKEQQTARAPQVAPQLLTASDFDHVFAIMQQAGYKLGDYELNAWQVVAGEQMSIIDGQQRLTTLLLMAKALSVALAPYFDHDAHKGLQIPSILAQSLQSLRTELGFLNSVPLVSQADPLANAVLALIFNGADLDGRNCSELKKVSDEEKATALDFSDYNFADQLAATNYWQNYCYFLEIFCTPEQLQQFNASLPDNLKFNGASVRTQPQGRQDLRKQLLASGFSDKLIGGSLATDTVASATSRSSSSLSSSSTSPSSSYSGNTQALPLLYYLAHGLLHNLHLVLIRFADEETGLRYFELTNTTGRAMSRLDHLKVDIYNQIDQVEAEKLFQWFGTANQASNQSVNLSSQSEPSSRITAKQSFSKFWAQWEANLIDIYRPFHKKVSETLYSVLNAYWQEHTVFELVCFMSAYEQVAAWGYLRERDFAHAEKFAQRVISGADSALGISDLGLSEAELTEAELYMQALVLLEDPSVLKEPFALACELILSHATEPSATSATTTSPAPTPQKPAQDFLPALRKHLLRTLYRKVLGVKDLDDKGPSIQQDLSQSLQNLTYKGHRQSRALTRFLLYLIELEVAFQAVAKRADSSVSYPLADSNNQLADLNKYVIFADAEASVRFANNRLRSQPTDYRQITNLKQTQASSNKATPKDPLVLEIEHIIPQSQVNKTNPARANATVKPTTANAAGKGSSKIFSESFIQSLANLALLESDLNLQVKDHNFSDKCERYQHSKLGFVKTLAPDLPQFTGASANHASDAKLPRQIQLLLAFVKRLQ